MPEYGMLGNPDNRAPRTPVSPDPRAIAIAQAAALAKLRRNVAEKDFQVDVQDLLTRGGWLWAHIKDARRQAATGLPDIVAVKGQRLLFAELKTMTGRVTPEQEEWLKRVKDAGAESFIWRPADWDSIAWTLLEVGGGR